MTLSPFAEVVTEVPSTRSNVDVTLKVQGDLTFYDARLYERAFQHHFSRTFRDMCIDMSASEHVDSTGIGIIVRLSQQLGDRGCLLLLEGVQPGVLKVFQVLKIDRVLSLV